MELCTLVCSVSHNDGIFAHTVDVSRSTCSVCLLHKWVCDSEHSVSSAVHDAQGWSLETLRKYLYWTKTSFQPTLSPEAEALLTGFYQAQRRLSDRSKALTTIRMLEGLIRIAQVWFPV